MTGTTRTTGVIIDIIVVITGETDWVTDGPPMQVPQVKLDSWVRRYGITLIGGDPVCAPHQARRPQIAEKSDKKLKERKLRGR